MTYSIVARDDDSGEMGVAVQTCNLAVGTWVPWAQGGVGAVATQAHAERTYGTLGLRLMDEEKPANEALDLLLAADEQREFRQVALVDTAGNVAVHTGRRCLAAAGHVTGEGFSAQANMVANDSVWPAMAEAFQTATGDLAQRLLSALDAAQLAGGDLRGQQTAALLVVAGEPAPFPLIDLRVDRAAEPLAELQRLLRLHRAYAAEYTIPDLVEAGDQAVALVRLEEIAAWAPDQGYLQFLRAYHLAGRLDRWPEGLEVMQLLVTKEPIWIEYLRRDRNTDTFGLPGLAASFLDVLGDGDGRSE